MAELTLEEQLAAEYERIARVVNTLRNNYTVPGIEGTLSDLKDIRLVIREEFHGKEAVKAGKGRIDYPEFKVTDAEKVVKEISKEHSYYIGMGDPQASLIHVARKLFKNIVFDEETSTVNLKAASIDDVEKRFASNPLDNDLDIREEILWEDSRYVTKGEFLTLSLGVSVLDQFDIMDADVARYIVGRGTRTPVTILPRTDDLEAQLSIRWLEAWNANLPNIRNFLHDGLIPDADGKRTVKIPGWKSGNTEDSIAALMNFYVNERPSDIISGDSLIPQYGNTFTDRREREIQEIKDRWGGWNINENIDKNVKRIIGEQVGKPGDRSLFDDSDERFARGETEREVIADLKYRMDSSVYEEGSEEWNSEAITNLIDILGSGFSEYTKNAKEKFDRIKAQEWDVRTGKNSREKAFERVLDSFDMEKKDLSEEDFRDIASDMGDYETFGEAMADELLYAQIYKAGEDKLTAEAREEVLKEARVDTQLEKLDDLMQQALSAAEYNRFQNAPEHIRWELSRMLAEYDHPLEAMGDPEFTSKIFGIGIGRAIWEGSEALRMEREEEEKEARIERLTEEQEAKDALNRDLKNSIFEEFRTRGIIGPDSSQEYLAHINNTVIPKMQQRSILGGGVTTREDIAALVDEAVGQPDRAGRFTGGYLDMFDVSEPEFVRQMVPTDLPPGVTPQMVARPTPAFDISQFAPELTELAFDRPEFEAFIEAEARKPEFQRSWEEAAAARPRRDRAAEISLQEERLASFQRAADIARQDPESIQITPDHPLWNEYLQAQENLKAAEQDDPTAVRKRQIDLFRIQLQARLAFREKRKREVGDPAQAALERAQAQFEREVPSQVTEGEPGFFQSGRFDPVRGKWIDNLADIRKTLVKPGKTQRQFFESQLPGFERRFEASPFFKQEEERLKRQTEIEEEKKRVADEEAESDRRTLLRSGRGGGVGSARTIFRRGRM